MSVSWSYFGAQGGLSSRRQSALMVALLLTAAFVDKICLPWSLIKIMGSSEAGRRWLPCSPPSRRRRSAWWFPSSSFHLYHMDVLCHKSYLGQTSDRSRDPAPQVITAA